MECNAVVTLNCEGQTVKTYLYLRIESICEYKKCTFDQWEIFLFKYCKTKYYSVRETAKICKKLRNIFLIQFSPQKMAPKNG